MYTVGPINYGPPYNTTWYCIKHLDQWWRLMATLGGASPLALGRWSASLLTSIYSFEGSSLIECVLAWGPFLT